VVTKVTQTIQKRLPKGRKHAMQTKAQGAAQVLERDGWEHPQVDNKRRGLGSRLPVVKVWERVEMEDEEAEKGERVMIRHMSWGLALGSPALIGYLNLMP
jgi:hypothetical protein